MSISPKLAGYLSDHLYKWKHILWGNVNPFNQNPTNSSSKSVWFVKTIYGVNWSSLYFLVSKCCATCFFIYSSDILFLHQSTGGLPVPGFKTLVDSMSTNKPSTSLTHVACETKLHSVVTSSMHPCLGNCVAIGHAVVYHARAAHAFRAGIKCRHCTLHGHYTRKDRHQDYKELEITLFCYSNVVCDYGKCLHNMQFGI